jgi:limonene-1,2-epoxide hydrolase
MSMRHLLLALTLIWVSIDVAAIEEPKYAVISEYGDSIEIRYYEPQVVAATIMNSGQNSGFRVLAGYIFGGNEREEKIAMTAPVTTSMGSDGTEMQFMMPSEYSLDELPAPEDKRVLFKELPAYTAAVIRFSGRANGRMAEEQWSKLQVFLGDSEWQMSGSPTLNQYNPPWIPGYFRRNEIIVPVRSKQEISTVNEQKLATAKDMLDAWNTLDWERVYQLFGEAGVLHNMMLEPTVGNADIRERFKAFEDGLTRMEFIVLNMGMLGDDVVIERLDSFEFNGRTGLVPVTGVLSIDEGQVKEWREYYDRNWLLSEMGVIDAEPPHPLAPQGISIDRDSMSDDERLAVAQAMLDAYRQLDWQAAANLIADDGVIHYAEKDPMIGPDAMRKHTARLGSLLTHVDFDVRNMGVVNGVVMIERHDEIEFNGHRGRVPVLGAMEIEDGKIKVWREYFDQNQMMQAMGLASN